MIGCLRTLVRKQPIIALYFESELVLKFYNLEAWSCKLPFSRWLPYKHPEEERHHAVGRDATFS